MGKIKNVVGKTATTVYTDTHGAVCCKYHQTVVAKALALATGITVTLDSGGYRTATTKVRMNEFARQFCFGGYSVSQSRGQWFVNVGAWDSADARTIPFEDGVTFVVRTDKVIGKVPAGWDKV